MNKILIEDLKIKAYHGVYDFECENGNDFIVNLELTTDFSKAAQSDDLKDAVDYEKAVQAIREEMAKPSNLLENVGKRIIDRLKSEFIDIQKVKIKLSKLNPPIKDVAIHASSIVIEE